MRKGITSAQAKEIIDKFYPKLQANDLKDYEELWESVESASKEDTLTRASCWLTDREDGEEITVEIHKLNPWTPSPSEATIMMAFCPNYLYAALATYDNEQYVRSFDDKHEMSIETEFRAHLEKMCKDVYNRSVRELLARRPGA